MSEGEFSKLLEENDNEKLFELTVTDYENNEERKSAAAQLNASLAEMQHKSECIRARLSGAGAPGRVSLKTLCAGLNASIANFHRNVGVEYDDKSKVVVLNDKLYFIYLIDCAQKCLVELDAALVEYKFIESNPAKWKVKWLEAFVKVSRGMYCSQTGILRSIVDYFHKLEPVNRLRIFPEITAVVAVLYNSLGPKGYDECRVVCTDMDNCVNIRLNRTACLTARATMAQTLSDMITDCNSRDFGQVEVDNGVYKGAWKDGLPDGKGELEYNDGTLYIGEFRLGRYHGHGTFTYKDGSTWEGEWVDGKRHGDGVAVQTQIKYTPSLPQADLDILLEAAMVAKREVDNSLENSLDNSLGRMNVCSCCQEWRDASKEYDGERNSDGKPHGRGKMVWRNGDITRTYVGSFVDGEQHGHGEIVHSDSQVRYSGEWYQGRREGKGTMTYECGNVYEGTWHDGIRHGNGVLFYNDGGKYHGEWMDGKKHGVGREEYDGHIYFGDYKDNYPHGCGTKVWANGDKYIGQFKEGKFHGQGKKMYACGNTYTGEWQNGFMEGVGSFQCSDGKLYEGEWQRGKKHGRGQMKYSNERQEVYVGQFVDNHQQGWGKILWKDGSQYVGNFERGKFHGYGTIVHPNGTIYAGNWEHNKPSGPGHKTWIDKKSGDTYGQAGIWEENTCLHTTLDELELRLPSLIEALEANTMLKKLAEEHGVEHWWQVESHVLVCENLKHYPEFMNSGELIFCKSTVEGRLRKAALLQKMHEKELEALRNAEALIQMDNRDKKAAKKKKATDFNNKCRIAKQKRSECKKAAEEAEAARKAEDARNTEAVKQAEAEKKKKKAKETARRAEAIKKAIEEANEAAKEAEAEAAKEAEPEPKPTPKPKKKKEDTPEKAERRRRWQEKQRQEMHEHLFDVERFPCVPLCVVCDEKTQTHGYMVPDNNNNNKLRLHMSCCKDCIGLINETKPPKCPKCPITRYEAEPGKKLVYREVEFTHGVREIELMQVFTAMEKGDEQPLSMCVACGEKPQTHGYEVQGPNGKNLIKVQWCKECGEDHHDKTAKKGKRTLRQVVYSGGC